MEKVFEKVLEYVERERSWLLVLGRIGVHSDTGMDIGSNTENLLRMGIESAFVLQANSLTANENTSLPFGAHGTTAAIWSPW